ncbi:tetratricopeptide repeat protein, partial [Zoogloea ramigera]|uniref:tetratricopeptide repeat protein n=1 Tax=Zoogloea ramigera TaxID=350 RepID=UPI003FA26EC4
MKRGVGVLRVTVLAFGLIGPMTARADVGELNRQVVQLYQQGKYGGAIPLAQQAVAEAEANFGPDDARTATSLNNLAGLYESMGRYDEALPLYRRALAI